MPTHAKGIPGMADRYYCELAAEARKNLEEMPLDQLDRVEAELTRAFEEPGREHEFGVLFVDGVPSDVWRTYAIPPYTVIFRFMTSTQRHQLGLCASAHLVAAIPDQTHLDEVKRRLLEEADPDDADWN